ncbi:MAG: class F sortase [Candidatus Peribacteraceae bacterium]|jgi:hypothetical protein
MPLRTIIAVLLLAPLGFLALVGVWSTEGGSASSLPFPAVRNELRGGAQPAAGDPVRLRIPALNVDAAVEDVGLTASGGMDVPKNWNHAGWFRFGARPGEAGNAVLAGHLDSPSAPAIFWDLAKLRPGDAVTVEDALGRIHTFTVTNSVRYTGGDAPMEELFGPTPRSLLRLITCEGEWDKEKETYGERLVVTARMKT